MIPKLAYCGRESIPDSSAIAVDPVGERVLKRGGDAYAGGAGRMFEPLDQVLRY